MKHHVINIFYSEENEGYIANIPEILACSAVGDTELEALQELLLVKAALVKVAELEAKSISPVSLEPYYVRASPKVRSSTKNANSTKPNDILALRLCYQGQTLLEAIAQVLKNLEGQKVNADMVVKELHDELSQDLYKIARDRVVKNLSKGKVERKWDSIPEQSGFYTYSLNKIKS